MQNPTMIRILMKLRVCQKPSAGQVFACRTPPDPNHHAVVTFALANAKKKNPLPDAGGFSFLAPLAAQRKTICTRVGGTAGSPGLGSARTGSTCEAVSNTRSGAIRAARKAFT